MNIRKKIGLIGCGIYIFCLFASCDKEKDISGQDGSIKRGDYYLSFQLKTGQSFMSTRATGLQGGTKEERAVSSIHILLYEALGENGRLLYNIPIRAQTNGTEDFYGQDVASGDKDHFISKPISLKKQDYQLLVLVNPSTGILAEKARSEEDYDTECNFLKDMLSAVSDTSADEFYNQGTHFFMCNAGGIIYISGSELQEKGENALLHPVSVPLERILAKISLHNDLKNDQVTFGGKIKSITWGVDITNKSTYLLRQPDYLSTGEQEIGFHSNREEVYARDPNFNSNGQYISNEEIRKEHFNILSVKDEGAFMNCNSDKNDNTWFQYVLENTMTRTDQNNDMGDPKLYTTQLVIKIIITEPRGMTDITDYYSFYDSAEPDEDKKWKIFTHVQAVEWFNGTFPSDMTALKEVLNKAQDMENSPFNFRKGEDQEPVEYISTSFHLTYHKNGLNIYRVPIQHFGANDVSKSVEDYGYYGIVRNNTYQLLIKSIKGTGIDSSNEGYIATDILLNPWFAREGEEDLHPGMSY